MVIRLVATLAILAAIILLLAYIIKRDPAYLVYMKRGFQLFVIIMLISFLALMGQRFFAYPLPI